MTDITYISLPLSIVNCLRLQAPYYDEQMAYMQAPSFELKRLAYVEERVLHIKIIISLLLETIKCND